MEGAASVWRRAEPLACKAGRSPRATRPEGGAARTAGWDVPPAPGR